MALDRNLNKPLYIQIYEKLLEDIRGQKFRSGDFLTSERDLSAIFQVDRLTVRKSLELLSEEGIIEKRPGRGTRVKPLPTVQASAQDARFILFILPKSINSVDRITEPFNSGLFSAVEVEARKAGFGTMYSTVGEDGILAGLTENSTVAGIVFVSQVAEKAVREAAARRFPVVTVNRVFEGITSVLEDRLGGAIEATRHLVDRGHRNILYISGIKGYYASESTREGFLRTLLEREVSAEIPPIACGDFTFDSGYNAMLEILSVRSNLPTAVLANNDMMALGAMEAAKEAGLAIPRDMSFIGFDNVDQCTHHLPALTTVSVEIPLLAKTAVQTLLNSKNNDSAQGLKIIVPTRLVLRDSTAPVAR